MAESERYLPDLMTKIEALLEGHGLAQETITVRMTGCPNGSARPYIAEIGFSGRATGKSNLYMGGAFHGPRLNRMISENVNEDTILNVLDEVFASYDKTRLTD